MANELSILELRGILRLSAKEARNWVRRHCPQEAVRREGSYVYIATWGLNAGLTRCKWTPRSPKGYQGVVGRIPVNIHHKDSLGRFVSHRPGHPSTPKRQEYTAPQRRRYLR